MSATKTCTRCLVPKSLDDFHRDASKRDGRRYMCRDCTRRDQAHKAGGYVSPARRFMDSFRSTLDVFSVVDAELNRPAPPQHGRYIPVHSDVLAGLLAGDTTARAEASRLLAEPDRRTP